jgi:thioester reductase-like protein
MLDIIEAAFHQFGAHPLDVALYELVKACVAAHAINPALHRVLNEQVPRLNQTTAEAKITTLLREFLQQKRDRIQVQNLELTLFILKQTVESLTEAAVTDHPEFLKEGQLEEEITKMLLSYLFAQG